MRKNSWDGHCAAARRGPGAVQAVYGCINTANKTVIVDRLHFKPVLVYKFFYGCGTSTRFLRCSCGRDRLQSQPIKL